VSVGRGSRPRAASGNAPTYEGPNGAGKTTTVQILSTLITADGGDVRVDDPTVVALLTAHFRRRLITGARAP
jgi:ABC-type multidrug transport system ATPase subunit